MTSERLTQAERQERTRGSLITVAQDLLVEDRLELPISEICKQAGTAVGSFYNYFESREDLYSIAAITAINAYQPKLQSIVDRFENAAQGIIASFRHGFHLPELNPRLAKLIVHAGPQAFTRFDLYGTPPQQQLQAAVDAGHATCDDVVGFLVAISGAYQNSLAFSLNNPNYTMAQADYTVAIFARELGFSEALVAKLCSGPVEQPS